jgi:putative cardiolipin synthase
MMNMMKTKREMLFLLTFILGTLFSFVNLSAKVYDFTENNDLKLLENAKESAEYKLDLIRNAKHHIHLITFYIDKSEYPKVVIEELKKAHERGVEIRILTTMFPSLLIDLTGKVKKDLKKINISSDIKNEAVFSFLDLRPDNNLSIYNNVHEKLLIIDGKVAVTGGRNLSDNSLHAKDIEVLVSGDVVHQLQNHFKGLFDFILKKETKRVCKNSSTECISLQNSKIFREGDKKYFPDISVNSKVKMRLLTNDSLIQEDQFKYGVRKRFLIEDDILNTITSTEFSELRAYNYFILPKDAYKDFLFESVKSKKKISLICNGLKSASQVSPVGYFVSLPHEKEYVDHDIDVYEWQGPTDYEYMHEKVLIFDKNHFFVGSHNLGIGSSNVSSELMLEVYSDEIASHLAQVFDSSKR